MFVFIYVSVAMSLAGMHAVDRYGPREQVPPQQQWQQQQDTIKKRKITRHPLLSKVTVLSFLLRLLLHQHWPLLYGCTHCSLSVRRGVVYLRMNRHT